MSTTYFSHSIGGAIAIGLLARELNYTRCRALIIQNTFTSVIKIANIIAKNYACKSDLFTNEKYFSNLKFESDKLIANIKCPILVACSLKDKLVPPKMSEELFNLAVNSSYKRLYVAKNMEHNNIADGDGYYDTLLEFLNKAVQLKLDY